MGGDAERLLFRGPGGPQCVERREEDAKGGDSVILAGAVMFPCPSVVGSLIRSRGESMSCGLGVTPPDLLEPPTDVFPDPLAEVFPEPLTESLSDMKSPICTVRTLFPSIWFPASAVSTSCGEIPPTSESSECPRLPPPPPPFPSDGRGPNTAGSERSQA